MPKKTKIPTIHPDDLADALEDALQTTNELLGCLVTMMSCADCRGTGERPTRDVRSTERCSCRKDAAELLYVLREGDEREDGDEDGGDDDEDGGEDTE